MITQYNTKSGGLYEVDDEAKKFRRVKGGSHSDYLPSEWTPYESVQAPEGRLVIFDRPGHYIVTSAIVGTGTAPAAIDETACN